jgi:hypothetical protein
MVPPIGRLSAPATCTRPLAPRITPGVASAWMVNRAAITENAMPSHTARPSLRRAAMTDIATDAAIARMPATPTTAMWITGATISMCVPVRATSSVGTSAACARTTPTGSRARI